MTDSLSQTEAERLIYVEKKAETSEVVKLPGFGGKVAVPLVSVDERDAFTLDISRGRIELKKGTNQIRTRHVFVLVRLDYYGPPHRNPDDEEISSPHIHLYKEGWGDKWAYPLPEGVFSKLDDHWITLQEFLTYCSVVKVPEFNRGLS